jgi:hypothetical protein
MDFWQQQQMQKIREANDPFGIGGQGGRFSSAWQQDAMNPAPGLAGLVSAMDPVLSGGRAGAMSAMSGLPNAALSNVTDPNEMEESSGWGDYLLGALEKGLGTLDQYDGKLTDVMYPSRGAIQWTPRENPGLAGLMRQIDAISDRAYGR